MSLNKRNAAALFVGWMVLMALALPLDRMTAVHVKHHAVLQPYPLLIQVLRLPGRYPFIFGIGILIALLHRRRWQAAAPLLLTGLPVGIIYTLVKWSFGRARPKIAIAPFTFHPFENGLHGLFFNVPGLSFPSGDAMMAAAAAAALSVLLPRWSAAFWTWALVVGAERVLENAHYLSDVVTATACGVLCAWIATWISTKVSGFNSGDLRFSRLDHRFGDLAPSR